jgi:PAS domain S-box-containing protein
VRVTDPDVTWTEAIDSIALPVSVHDLHHVVRLANAAFVEAVGMAHDQVIGRRCFEMTHCTDRPLPNCPHRELLENGKSVEREYLSADESHVVAISCFPLRKADGSLFGSVHMIRDVTEVAHLRDRWERRSRTVAAYLGTLRDFLGDPRNLHGRTIPFENENLAPCYRVKGCTSHQCPVQQSGGTSRCWHGHNHAFQAFCMRSGPDDPLERLAFCQACEVYRRATPDDLSALTELFNDLVYLLQVKQAEVARTERLAVLGELSSILAHDLRTPLNALAINVQRLGRKLGREGGASMEDLVELQRDLLAEVQRADRVISDYTLLARRPAERLQMIKRDELLQLVTGSLVLRAQQAGVELETLFEPPEPVLDANLTELVRTVVLNLVLNAIEATRPGDRIRLWSRWFEGVLELEISDTGPGVPDALKSRVFEPFFTTKPQGTGLGLAVVDGQVRRAGGTVAISDAIGGGAVFSVRLPCPELEKDAEGRS